jgi:hypothetical protein
VSEKRLALTSNGNIRYHLKTPYRDGTTEVIFEPLDFIAKLAALVPKPRVNLTRFHGVFVGMPPNPITNFVCESRQRCGVGGASGVNRPGKTGWTRRRTSAMLR